MNSVAFNYHDMKKWYVRNYVCNNVVKLIIEVIPSNLRSHVHEQLEIPMSDSVWINVVEKIQEELSYAPKLVHENNLQLAWKVLDKVTF